MARVQQLLLAALCVSSASALSLRERVSNTSSDLLQAPHFGDLSYAVSWATSALSPALAWAQLELRNEDFDSCGERIQHKYNCTSEACEDLVPGYINYIEFYECATGENKGLQFLVFVLFLGWLLFLLHLVETTTNDYFCTSLQLAVAILKLSPNVAGVTFLAVGNAACDVIASIAAFSSGVPKVGVGTTVGAGIFVTSAVIAAVSFVADVRLARRSFVRDIVFFIVTVLYLLFTTLDGIIKLWEAIGFIVIYVLFVFAVAGGRFLKFLRMQEDDEKHGMAVAGSDGEEGQSAAAQKFTKDHREKSRLVLDSSGFQAASLTGMNTEAAGGPASALDAARRAQLGAVQQREMDNLRHAKYFAPEASDLNLTGLGVGLGQVSEADDEEEEEDAGDGDLGGGSGDASTRFGGGDAAAGAPARKFSMIDEMPKKPSKWTRAFLSTQIGSGHVAFQLPRYHKRALLKQVLDRMKARGNTRMAFGAETIDLAELAVSDPDSAMDIAAAMASSITAAAASSDTPLTFNAAVGAARDAVEHQKGMEGHSPSANVSVSVADVMAVLPHETVKPTARMYLRFKRFFGVIYPYYHGFMSVAELPVVLLRHLTIPLMHEGSYRRRLVVINTPFSFAFCVLVLTSHILEMTEEEASVGGVPYFLLAFLCAVPLAVAMHLRWLPSNPPVHRLAAAAGGAGGGAAGGAASHSLLGGSAGQSLLGADHHSAATSSNGHDAVAPGHGGEGAPKQHEHAHGHKKNFLKRLGTQWAGPNTEPLPTGVVFSSLLVLSFLMALFWLLIIANEIVGTAICFGKVLGVPDVVMGLTVLAIGNSINDLAATITIAKEGFPTMAVAGAYAGPMFNILAGIGLPMVLYTAKREDHQFNIGQDTPLVWLSFITLLFSLTVTLIWVPLEGWRITHRIGRFLLAVFFTFIVVVLIVGLFNLSPADSASAVSP